jgi:type IV pilus assembly protein PilB
MVDFSRHEFKDEWLAKSLVENGIIENDLLDQLRQQFGTAEYLTDVLIQNNFFTEDDLVAFVTKVLKVPFVNLDEARIQKKAVELVPEQIARKFEIFPFQMDDSTITIASANPFNLDAEKEVEFVAGRYVKTVFCHRRIIVSKLNEYYTPDKVIGDIVDKANIDADDVEAEGASMDEAESAPIVKLVNMIISGAIDQDASDIHIEPLERAIVVRFRVDGVLRKIMEIPAQAGPALVSRIKIISNLDIAETRRPQDGKAKVRKSNRAIDLRVSTVPTPFGEKVVIRILDPAKAMVDLRKLGVQGENLEKFEKILSMKQGIVLVTGPTGSGKTTTLYACLNQLKQSGDTNIMTVEDPIEYMLPGINQVQVNEKAGVTFASALRAFLRQDPDVILVGETRDLETAQIAIQASLTGHLVFSTLHTNDALTTVTRLIDMGVEPHKVASSLSAVIAQRLVRRICSGCKVPVKPGPQEKKILPYLKKLGIKPQFAKGKGCNRCGFTGYKGRIALYEILMLDDELKDMIARGEPLLKIKKTARRKGFKTLYESAVMLIGQGVTDFKEVARVIQTTGQEEKDEEKPIAPPTQPVQTAQQTMPSQQPQAAAATPRPQEPLVQAPQERINPFVDDEPKRDKKLILIAEDTDSIRKMVKQLLMKKGGYDVIEAENGQIALDMINKHKPDMVILDIMMPELNGYEVLKAIRSSLATLTLPVIMLTALSNTKNELKGIELGADDYIVKPFNPEILLARVSRLFKRIEMEYNNRNVQLGGQSGQTLNVNML